VGHLHDIKAEYRALQQRLDQGPAAAPARPELFEVLGLIFTPEEARTGAVMPWKPVTAAQVARLLDEPVAQVRERLERMADRGLVFDFASPRSGTVRYVLAPPVVGFVEFTLMRVRADIDQPQVARALHELFFGDPVFAQRTFAPGLAQIGRALAHEDQLPEDGAEVLDWERASALIREAGGGALSLCYCRHKGEHVGQPCRHPLDVCTSLLPGADWVLRRGFGRPASTSELLEVLVRCREAGLVQIADNVQHRPSYLCHCCACHCGQLLAITRFGLKHAVRTSSFIAEVSPTDCNGCGRCLRRCPVGAISVVQGPPAQGLPGRPVAVIDESLCLGCGVCPAVCSKSALRLVARPVRLLTPRNTLERIVLRAMERGALHHLLFGSPETRTQEFLHRLVGVVEGLPPVRRLELSQALQSRFLSNLGRFTRNIPLPP